MSVVRAKNGQGTLSQKSLFAPSGTTATTGTAGFRLSQSLLSLTSLLSLQIGGTNLQ